MTEKKGDQNSADAAIAVEKRMNRFELHVREAGPYQHRKAIIFGVQKFFERRHFFRNSGVRRRHERRIARPRAAEPILRSAKLSGVLVAAAAAGKKHAVDLANESIRERKSVA